MSFETEMRERVKRGESLDSIMEEIASIANKIEQEKKEVDSRESYIKELEEEFYSRVLNSNASRDWKIASIILTLNVADKVLGATRENLEQIYDTINEGTSPMIEELTNFLNFVDNL